MALNIPKLQMNDGRFMPAVGLGTAPELSEAGFSKEAMQKVVDVTIEGILLGYRHFDTAHIYRTEEQIGEGVKHCIDKGIVKREELFITTKLWNHQHHPKDVESAIRESLRKLKMDYVDLYLIHWPMAIAEDGTHQDIDFVDTWKAMEKLRDLGLAKSIGVSNFNIEQLTRLLANCRIKPAANQLEVNLNLQVPDLVKFCKEQNILITAYTSFGSIIGYRSVKNEKVTKADHPVLVNLSKKYNKSIGQILLGFLVQQGIAVIPKTTTKSRLTENANIFDFKFTNEEMKSLAQFNTGWRTIAEPWWANHKDWPFPEYSSSKCPPIPKDLLA